MYFDVHYDDHLAKLMDFDYLPTLFVWKQTYIAQSANSSLVSKYYAALLVLLYISLC